MPRPHAAHKTQPNNDLRHIHQQPTDRKGGCFLTAIDHFFATPQTQTKNKHVVANSPASGIGPPQREMTADRAQQPGEAMPPAA